MIYNRFSLIKEFISRDDLFVVLHAVVFSVPCLPYDFFRRYFVNKTSTLVLLYSEIKCRINSREIRVLYAISCLELQSELNFEIRIFNIHIYILFKVKAENRAYVSLLLKYLSIFISR